MRGIRHQNDSRRTGLFGQRYRELRILHRTVGPRLHDDPIGRVTKADKHIAHLIGLGHPVLRIAAGHDDERVWEHVGDSPTGRHALIELVPHRAVGLEAVSKDDDRGFREVLARRQRLGTRDHRDTEREDGADNRGGRPSCNQRALQDLSDF
ncbi:Uncharacterised protein [Mycobacteroides abscessus subsp. massiliense]|nr:Uncharacterised protein [Mycobacteroides abscessus subsp. massiliense]